MYYIGFLAEYNLSMQFIGEYTSDTLTVKEESFVFLNDNHNELVIENIVTNPILLTQKHSEKSIIKIIFRAFIYAKYCNFSPNSRQ